MLCGLVLSATGAGWWGCRLQLEAEVQVLVVSAVWDKILPAGQTPGQQRGEGLGVPKWWWSVQFGTRYSGRTHTRAAERGAGGGGGWRGCPSEGQCILGPDTAGRTDTRAAGRGGGWGWGVPSGGGQCSLGPDIAGRTDTRAAERWKVPAPSVRR